MRSLRFELGEACALYERLQAERNDVHFTMSTVRKNEPRYERRRASEGRTLTRVCSEVYLNGLDHRLLDFFLANLELRLGTQLKSVALSGFADLLTNTFGSQQYAGALRRGGEATCEWQL